MARSRGAAIAEQEFSADEQAEFDAMRSGDALVDDVSATANDGDQSPASDGAAEATVAEEGQSGGAPQQGQQNTMVPHRALHEERELRKAAEAREAEVNTRMRLVEERTNLLLQRFSQPTQPVTASAAEAIPDSATDPAGHILAVMKRQETQIAQLSQALQQRGQVDQGAAVIANVQQQAVAAEQDFIAAGTADYPQAAQYLRQFRAKQLSELGYSPVEQAQMINAEALGVAARAIGQNKNPAAVIYALAQHSGYKAPSANGDGAADATAQPTAGERLARVAAGQQQGRGLGGARGAGPAPLTAQRLAEMSDSDFEKAMNTEEGRALFGI